MEAVSNYQKDYSGEESAVVDDEVEQDSTELGSSTTARSYDCIFCKRGFTTAQALGGHMNIHRKDRAKQSPIITSINPNHHHHHHHHHRQHQHQHEGDDDYDDQDRAYNSAASPIFCYQPIQIYPHQVPQINYSYQPYFPASPPCPSTTTAPSYINNIHQNPHPDHHLMNSLGSPVDWRNMSLSLQLGTHLAAQDAENKKQGGSHEEEEEEEEEDGLDLELRLGQNP